MYIVFDIGGTKTRIASSQDLHSFSEPRIFPTVKNFTDGLRIFSQIIRELTNGEKIESCAGGIAGLVEKNTGKIFQTPNLPDWSGQELGKILGEDLVAPIFIENDTAMAGLGEAWSGAGQDKNIVAYLTISTGVGGTRIVDRQIDQSVIGFEPGHQIIDIGSVKNGSNDHSGHLDDLISGQAFQNRFGRPAYEVTDEKIWQATARLLAIGLYNTILHWSPTVIVLGGSMMKTPGIKIEAVTKELGRLPHIFPTLPEIKKATLGDLSGLYGSLAYLRQKNNR